MTKIAALINQHLFVYTTDNNNKIVEEIIIDSLSDVGQNIFPFDIQINNFKLIIYIVENDEDNSLSSRSYNIKSYSFKNYSAIIPSELDIKICSVNLINFPTTCKFVEHSSSINAFMKMQQIHI